MRNKTISSNQNFKRYYLFKVLFIGFISILAAIYNTPKSFYIFDFLLTEVCGEIELVEKVNTKNTSFLQIKFKNNTKKYILKDIGNINYYIKISRIIDKLETSKKATVLVKKSSVENSEIEIYQISDTSKVLFHINDIDSHKKFRFYLTLCVGFFAIASFLVNKKNIYD